MSGLYYYQHVYQSVQEDIVWLCHTCVVPSAPVGFVNVSRTASSVSFSWNAPVDINGILRDYKVTDFAVQDSCFNMLSSE